MEVDIVCATAKTVANSTEGTELQHCDLLQYSHYPLNQIQQMLNAFNYRQLKTESKAVKK